METLIIFIGIGLIFWLGIAVGAAGSRPPVRVDYEGQHNKANNEGYYRARLTIKPGMTLDELVLVLHRNEGLLQGIRDNVTDVKAIVKTYGAQDDNSNPTA